MMALYPIQSSNEKAMEWQRIMVPRPGRRFVFTVTPGASYASVGEVYTCSGFPNTNDPWGGSDISLHNVSTGSGTFDRLAAWKYAEWHYVDDAS